MRRQIMLEFARPDEKSLEHSHYIELEMEGSFSEKQVFALPTSLWSIL